MICVQFGVGNRKAITLGPAPSYLLSGDVLCIGPVWYVAAVYRDHAWEVRGRQFARFQFIGEGLTLADLDRARGGQAGRFGPFDEVIVADGVVFTDDKPFAKFVEETAVWDMFEPKSCLRNIIVEPDQVVRDSTRDGPTILGRPQHDGRVDLGEVLASDRHGLLPEPPGHALADEASGEVSSRTE
jgi:hypothetical protein